MIRFVGRERELSTLEAHYGTGRFEMVVVYGRRRLGKTALCREFCRGKRHVFFTALEKSDGMNLRNFSRCVCESFGIAGPSGFETWGAAFSFIATQQISRQGEEGPLVVVMDEFPYAAKANGHSPPCSRWPLTPSSARPT